jgi:ribonuclease D
VELDKAHTRADWRRRPLAPEWLSYAADDVRYLPELYRRQRAALEQRNWLDALAEDFQALCHPDRYRLQPREAWRRVREHHRLNGMQRAVLRALAAWREERASADDRPRRWILDDAALIELARRMPRDAEQLQRLRGLPAVTVQRHGADLLERIAAARAEPPDQWPVRPARPHLTPSQIVRVDEWLALIAVRAREHGIPPPVCADRRDVENLLAGMDSPLRQGWRAALIGRELQARLTDGSHV